MTHIKRFLLLVIVALLGYLAFTNQKDLGTSLTLACFKMQLTLVFGFWLLLSFLAGVLLFLVIDLPRTLSLKREVGRKAQEISRLQFELTRIQSGSPPAPPNLEKRLGL
jgi:uncharacterized integral membrane protein